MIYYHSLRIENEIIAALVGKGHDVSVPDESMSGEDLYNAVLEADLVLLEDNSDTESGFVLGLAAAFGKPVYVGGGAEGRSFEFEGCKAFHTLLEAAEAMLREQESDDVAQLDGSGAGTGADPEHG